MIMRIHKHYSPLNALELDTYDPNKLIDHLMRKTKLRNDAALSRLLGYHPAIVSKLRHRSTPISPENILRIHEVTGIPVKELREIVGVPANYPAPLKKGDK